MRRRTRDWLFASAFSVFPVSEALAQSATNVATVALDAFGEKVGSEQIGLYSEQAVRGFSLQESGNYRLDGAYFIRSANIPPANLDGATIRVGINALGIDFPAPSGIVDYRLSVATPGAREELELAWRDYGGYAYLLRGSAATRDGKFGAAYAYSYMDEVGSDGQRRRPRWYGLTPTWRPNDKLQVRALFSLDRYWKPGGDFGFVLNGTELPPPQPNPQTFTPEWGYISQVQIAEGVVVRYSLTDEIALQSSYVVTDLERWRADFTTLAVGADGTGTATVIQARPNEARSNAAETRLHWEVNEGQRLFTTLRWRKSRSLFRPGIAIPLGFFDQEAGLAPSPAPGDPPEVAPTVDEVRQVMGGIGYETDVTDRFWMRGALTKTRYEKDVAPPGLPMQSNVDSPWLYDAAATFTPIDTLTLFATTVRGLEESGTAPNNANNRNEVLPAVIATQYELGLRYRVTPAVTFISSLFQITKPTPGIDTANVYRLIGEARHRGLELSLVGRPTPSINVVSGLVLLDADRKGELIDRGVLIGRAAGVSKVTGLLNVTYQVPFVKGLSFDGQLNVYSKMLLNPRTGVYTPGYATFDLGARYAFEIGNTPATLRARIGNLFDEDQWIANRNETLGRVARRAFRLSLITNFNH